MLHKMDVPKPDDSMIHSFNFAPNSELQSLSVKKCSKGTRLDRVNWILYRFALSAFLVTEFTLAWNRFGQCCFGPLVTFRFSVRLRSILRGIARVLLIKRRSSSRSKNSVIPSRVWNGRPSRRMVEERARSQGRRREYLRKLVPTKTPV